MEIPFQWGEVLALERDQSRRIASKNRPPGVKSRLVLVLYRKREDGRRSHEHDRFARFRYNDLKEAARGCGGRGPYANSMAGKSGVEVHLGCAAARHP